MYQNTEQMSLSCPLLRALTACLLQNICEYRRFFTSADRNSLSECFPACCPSTKSEGQAPYLPEKERETKKETGNVLSAVRVQPQQHACRRAGAQAHRLRSAKEDAINAGGSANPKQACAHHGNALDPRRSPTTREVASPQAEHQFDGHPQQGASRNCHALASCAGDMPWNHRMWSGATSVRLLSMCIVMQAGGTRGLD